VSYKNCHVRSLYLSLAGTVATLIQSTAQFLKHILVFDLNMQAFNFMSNNEKNGLSFQNEFITGK
jgi:hypothetical protein